MFKNKLNEKQKNLIIGIFGLIVFLASYFLVYQKQVVKNDEITNNINTRSTYYEELKQCFNDIELYKSGIYEYQRNIDNNLKKLPRGIKTEDFLVYMMEINDNIGSDMLSVDFAEPELVSEFECFINEELVAVSGYRMISNSNFTVTYDGLKQYLDYIYKKTNNVTYVDSISMTYDAENAQLSVSVSISKYYIEYDGADYIPVEVPQVPLGLSDLFGTRSVLQNNSENNEEEQNNENSQNTENDNQQNEQTQQ